METDFNEIRQLLERWYAGDSAVEIQDRLTELFAEASGLPDDLLLEREIFLAMHEVASCPVKMPDHLARRVDEAVSKEIAAPGRPRLRKTFRRWIYPAASAAACLLVAVVALRMGVQENPSSGDTQSCLASVEKTSVSAAVGHIADTLSAVVAAAPSLELVAEAGETGVRRKHCRKAHKPRSVSRDMEETAPVLKDDFRDDDLIFEEPDEPSRLLAANYRVVEDEQEASAIINAVFMRLEGRMNEESSHVDEIDLDYQVRMTKLYN